MRKSIAILVILLAAAIAIAIYIFGYREKRLPDIPKTSETAAVEQKTIINPSLSIQPKEIVQGDAILITLNGIQASNVRSLTFNGKSVKIFEFQGKISALLGIDLRSPTGTMPVILTLNDGRLIKEDILVKKRTVASEELGIPEKLGGNTSAGIKNVTTTLVTDNLAISKVVSTSTQLWTERFRYPIDGPRTITDPYGDTRLTVGTTIAHKGTDFRASKGTPVYAMNSGRIAFASYLNTYGNTIVLDHGLGLETIYMHLSEFAVKTGDVVRKGDLLGKSGDTGYVLGPHLHLSIKIDGTSVDPLSFMALIGS